MAQSNIKDAIAIDVSAVAVMVHLFYWLLFVLQTIREQNLVKSYKTIANKLKDCKQTLTNREGMRPKQNRTERNATKNTTTYLARISKCTIPRVHTMHAVDPKGFQVKTDDAGERRYLVTIIPLKHTQIHLMSNAFPSPPRIPIKLGIK